MSSDKDSYAETDPTEATVPDTLPTVRFDRMLAAYDREDDLTAQPFEFTDPEIIAETQAWVADKQRASDRPAMVMVGSVENGQWVNWNLEAVPRPPVPTHTSRSSDQ